MIQLKGRLRGCPFVLQADAHSGLRPPSPFAIEMPLCQKLRVPLHKIDNLSDKVGVKAIQAGTGWRSRLKSAATGQGPQRTAAQAALGRRVCSPQIIQLRLIRSKGFSSRLFATVTKASWDSEIPRSPPTSPICSANFPSPTTSTRC